LLWKVRDGCEQAGDDQQLEGFGAESAEHVVADLEYQVAAFGLRHLDGAVGPDGVDDQPCRHRVEDPHEDHRGVGGAGHGAFGLLGLLAVDRGALEPDEGGMSEHQRDADGPGEDRRRARTVCSEYSLTGVGPATRMPTSKIKMMTVSSVSSTAKHPGAGVDLTHTQQQRRCHRCEAEHPPRDRGGRCVT